jgi:sec-independent protein translocase protein TatA
MFAFDLGGSELLIILIVVVVLFGGAQLPKLARNLGEAQREFKKSMDHKDPPSESGDASTSGGSSSN